jgi:hypothetical protein
LGETVFHLPRPSSSPPEFRPFGRLKKGKVLVQARYKGETVQRTLLEVNVGKGRTGSLACARCLAGPTTLRVAMRAGSHALPRYRLTACFALRVRGICSDTWQSAPRQPIQENVFRRSRRNGNGLDCRRRRNDCAKNRVPMYTDPEEKQPTDKPTDAEPLSEEGLDESLEESFPASDPPAWTRGREKS